jgi:hypothetical protein
MNIHIYLKLNLKQHPRSANFADAIVGFRKVTRPNITTFVLNRNTKRRQIKQEFALTIKFWLFAVGLPSLDPEASINPWAGARKFAPGPPDT